MLILHQRARTIPRDSSQLSRLIFLTGRSCEVQTSLRLSWLPASFSAADAPSHDLIKATPEGVVEATRANLASTLTLSAEFRPYQEVEVHAKVAGYVKEIFVDVGDRVKTGQLLAILEIPGSPVAVTVQALGTSFQGKVSRFAERVDLSTSTMETEVDVPNPRLILVPGMYASTAVQLERRENVLSVPVQAVSGSGRKMTVLLVNRNNMIDERTVTVGIETPTRFEILSGLKTHDRVIIGSRSELKVGQLVEPKLIQITDATGEN